jgi:hypothetical protein
MRKTIIPILMISALFTACGQSEYQNAVTLDTAPALTDGSIPMPTQENPLARNVDTNTSAESTNTEVNPFSELIENEYEGLTITAAVLPRNAILSGMSIPITVILSNNGDSTISYIQGSGSYTIPNALDVRSDKLQTVVSEDRLGIATNDFVTKTLAPGESLSYTVTVRAINKNSNFFNYTMDSIAHSKYIGNTSWEELQQSYPDLEAAAPDSYDINIYFAYNISNDDDFLGTATGYIMTTLPITISE